MHRNEPKTSPILWWPPKNIHKISIPPKNIYFSENPKNNEIQNFEPPPPQNSPSLRMREISEYTLPPLG